MPDVVIFDLGGVLIDWDPRYLYRKLFAETSAMERFLAEVCPPAWNKQMDAGRPQAEALAERIARYPAFEAEIRAWRERWPEMLAGAIADSVALLEALHARGVPLYALTNWSAETWPHARERFAFLTRFRDIVVSGQEALVKPDPRLYRRLLDRHGLAPEACLFIDDVPDNVAAAEALGMTGHRFRHGDGLRDTLVRQGLL